VVSFRAACGAVALCPAAFWVISCRPPSRDAACCRRARPADWFRI
jgi:hypothetical protein